MASAQPYTLDGIIKYVGSGNRRKSLNCAVTLITAEDFYRVSEQKATHGKFGVHSGRDSVVQDILGLG